MMRKFNTQRGQTVILFTLGLTTMLGVAGLAVDIGWSYYREQAAQTAAEAAAMGAAKAALASASGGSVTCATAGVVCQAATVCPDPIPSPPTSNFHNGCLYAKDNGFVTTTTSGVKVRIAANTTSPPVSGLSASYWVTATVTSTERQGFSAVLGKFSGVVSAKSTAILVTSSTYGCIYVLNPTASSALQVGGTSSVTAPCGVYVNSNHSKALQVQGSACLNVSPGVVNVAGGYTGSNSCISPSPVAGASTFTDPMAGVPAPSWSGCDNVGTTNLSGGAVTLSPGVYCGGIKITGLADVTFLPGTYILNGGGFSVSGTNAKVTGAGVTFYNTGDASYAYDAISITGSGAISLSAPIMGSLANVLFFQDRAITSTATNTIAGGVTSSLVGVLYFRNSPLFFAGDSSTSNVAIVADTVKFTGSSRVTNSLTGGTSAGTTMGLVE